MNHPGLSYVTHLQDLADKASKEDHPILNFPLPASSPSTDVPDGHDGPENSHTSISAKTKRTSSSSSYATSYHEFMKIKNVRKKGKGFRTKKDLKAGTCLLVAKPLGIIMGWEEDEFDDESRIEDEDDNNVDDDIVDDDYTKDDEMNAVDDEIEQKSNTIPPTSSTKEDNNNQDKDEDLNSEQDLLQSNQRNGVLTIKILKAIQQNPSLWFDQISNLFPRKSHYLESLLPLWVCEDAKTGLEFEQTVKELESIPAFQTDDDDDEDDEHNIIEEIRQRLPLIVRYNCLSIETSPELFVYPDQTKGGHVSLSATGLYYEPSYFNHSHHPNVSRWCIGDIMFFVLNQDVDAGMELCISYIESELLCEDAKTRSRLLEMDFDDNDDNDVKMDDIGNDDDDEDDGDEDEMEGPVINLDIQDELMSMHPLNRLDEINRLLRQSIGSPNKDDILDEEENELVWYQCDTHRLRTILALTLDSLGQSSKALVEWKKCVEFTQRNLPPADEAGIALCVQTALCAHVCGEEGMAREYAKIALENHDLIFGGGVEFFQRRYMHEMKLTLRQGKKALVGKEAFETLWSQQKS